MTYLVLPVAKSRAAFVDGFFYPHEPFFAHHQSPLSRPGTRKEKKQKWRKKELRGFREISKWYAIFCYLPNVFTVK